MLNAVSVAPVYAVMQGVTVTEPVLQTFTLNLWAGVSQDVEHNPFDGDAFLGWPVA